MAPSFLSSFDCVNISTALFSKENDHLTAAKPRESLSGLSKVAYSLKDKKLVEKVLNPKKSLKSLKRSSIFDLDQKQNQKETQNTKKQIKTLQIIREVAVQLQPTRKSIEIQTQASLIHTSHTRLPSYGQISMEDHLKSTQELQLWGAQSVVQIDSMKLKNQISNKNDQQNYQQNLDALQDLGKNGMNGAGTLTRQSVNSNGLQNFGQRSDKGIYKSVLVNEKLKIYRNGQKRQENCQSLKNFNNYFQRYSYEGPSCKNLQKTTENSTTFTTVTSQNSIGQSLKSKLGEIKRFQEMEVRSAESIKEEESGDEFSQVLSRSHVSSSSKKISLSWLNLSKKYNHQQ